MQVKRLKDLSRFVMCKCFDFTKNRKLERVGSWVPGGSVGRDQLAMAAKVRRHWFNPCRLGSRGHLGADFSLLLYTDLIKKRKPSRHITDEGELIREHKISEQV